MKTSVMTMLAGLFTMSTAALAQPNPVPGKDGNKYVPYEKRTGNESIVHFTRSLDPEGLIKAYEQVPMGHQQGRIDGTDDRIHESHH